LLVKSIVTLPAFAVALSVLNASWSSTALSFTAPAVLPPEPELGAVIVVVDVVVVGAGAELDPEAASVPVAPRR